MQEHNALFRLFRTIGRGRAILLAALGSVFLITPTVQATVPTEGVRVGDFALLDHSGKFHQLSWYGDQKAIVIVAQGNADTSINEHVATLEMLHNQDHTVVFLLNAVLADNRSTIAAEVKDKGLKLPVLVDDAQLVAESLGITRVGEAVVIDPQSMEVSWRGNAAGVAQFLAQGTANVPGAPAAEGDASGAAIKFASKQAHVDGGVSYTNDIAPILIDNCVSCHHDGAIAPWSMSSHAMIRGWSPMIREVLMTRRMPPGQIDMHVGKPIAGVAGLTAKERQQLVHWIDAGSPVDGDVDPLAQLTFNDPLFSLGEPDMIVTVPAQEIPATGLVDYRYVPVELNLDKDVWVRAMEFVPGDRAVLHHVIAYLSSPADKSQRGRENGAPRGASVAGFAPGRQPDQFRDNSGRLITKGSNLLLQMHYTTSGKATVDETQVGIYLHDKPPTYVMSEGVAGQRRFFVPAHTKEHPLQGEQLIEKDAWLYSMTPHMHFRGKFMSYTAHYPDGSSELLLSVPKYDFNWQFSYELEEPVFLPEGTRLVADGAMDNSDRNPGNPDPSKPVHFGLQTKHEMFFGFITLRYEGDTPESIRGATAKTGSKKEPVASDKATPLAP